MNTATVLRWIPRGLAIIMGLFLALFAMDALNEEGDLATRLGGLFMHLTPTWLCLITLLVAWKREWIGAIAFGLFALGYVWYASDHADWILVISGPLLLVAAAYTAAWRMSLRARR